MTKSTTTTVLEVVFMMVLGVTALVFSVANPHITATANTQAVASIALPLQQATVTPPTELIAAVTIDKETIYKLDIVHKAPHYLTLPMPATGNSWDDYKQLIVTAAKYVEVEPDIVTVITAIESEFITSAANPDSNALGLCQFIPGTWKTMAVRYGEKYGITANTSRTDPRANMIMCALYLNENKAYLEKQLNRKIQPTELYMAHFLGAGGALSIIKARGTALASNIRPDAAASNRNIFYAKVGKHDYRARTVTEFKQNLRNKVKVQMELYGEAALAYSELLHGSHVENPIAINYQLVDPTTV